MKKYTGIILCAAAFIMLLLKAEAVTESARFALSTCGGLILPTLFPFFVISILLSRMGLPQYLGRLLAPGLGRLFNISGAGVTAFIVGLCGGYPMGAAFIGDMLRAGQIDSEEAERLLCFCNNSGPAFIISAVGAGVFSSSKIGLRLYLIHIAAAAVTGLIIRRGGRAPRGSDIHIETMSFSEALPYAVRQAVTNILNVCGFAASFTVLSSLIDSLPLCGWLSELTGLEPGFFHALLTGLLELGSGAGAMLGLAPTGLNLSLAAFLLGFGGLSVHFQTKAIISDSGAKGALHTAGRLLSGAISALLATIVF